MAQLTSAKTPVKGFTKDGKIFVSPNYKTIPRTKEVAQHHVFVGMGAGQKNFLVVTYDDVPSQEVLAKSVVRGRLELDIDFITLIDFNYPENGVTKNQAAALVEGFKINGEK
ncbi:hypothetical protein [Lactococcus lactis]|uniref:hypothetical protein n=1 Tax=Lactococcus lactis TaxID=1358 RepID=UPI0015C2D710|nr:hypothetical protein [Lactococcus lactis]QLF90330.1 hypothetical protein HPC60_06485 [Lactococcus lactis subsp. lactis]QPS94729.1 hypothetical protein I6G44_09385 [Lactococcus lactis]